MYNVPRAITCSTNGTDLLKFQLNQVATMRQALSVSLVEYIVVAVWREFVHQNAEGTSLEQIANWLHDGYIEKILSREQFEYICLAYKESSHQSFDALAESVQRCMNDSFAITEKIEVGLSLPMTDAHSRPFLRFSMTV